MSQPHLVTARAIPLSDGAILEILRKSKVQERIRLGPNEVHAFITHKDGSIEDLGISHNLLTTVGRDLAAAGLGSPGFGVSATIATASSATSLTATGTPFTVDQYKGWIVVAEEGTNAPVWANIGSNTTSVLTVDAWKNGDDSAGTTPGATANYFIMRAFASRYMALTENASAAAAGDTALTGEITTGGGSRALVTYAHTATTATLTLVKAFSITATFPAIHKIGLLSASTSTAAGILIFESVLNADASVVSGDTLTVTDTVTLT